MEKKIKTGSGFSKKTILNLIETFGLHVELDRWNEPGREFMRIVARHHEDAGCIILYTDHLEVEANREKEYLQKLFIDFWKKAGELEFKKKLNDLITLK